MQGASPHVWEIEKGALLYNKHGCDVVVWPASAVLPQD